MFGIGEPKEMKFPARFKVNLERKTASGVMTFKCHVTGNFVARKGKPTFMIDAITVDGIQDMNLTNFYGTEVESVVTYAIEQVWPRLMGQAPRP